MIGVHFCELGLPVAFSFAALSAARAAASISTREKFPSLQENSGIGPFILLKGTMAVQGPVHVVGSSTVNLYSIVVSSVRVKYSVIFKASEFASW